MYRSTLSLTSSLDEGGWSTSHPGRSTPRKDRTHCTGGWVGPRAGLGRCGKHFPPPGFDPRTVQPVASRYTDWTIPAHTLPCTVLCLGYTGWSKSFCAPDVCIVIIRCSETFGSPCIKSILQNVTWEKVSYHMWDSIQSQMNPVLASRNW